MIGLFISQCTIFEQEYADITGICRWKKRIRDRCQNISAIACFKYSTDKKLAEEPDSTCPNFSLITGEYTFCKSYSKDCDPEERK